MHKFFSMYLFLFITLNMFRAYRAHHQERQIVSIQPLVAVNLCWWPCCVQIGSEFTPNLQIVSMQPLVIVNLCWWPCCVQIGSECISVVTRMTGLLFTSERSHYFRKFYLEERGLTSTISYADRLTKIRPKIP